MDALDVLDNYDSSDEEDMPNLFQYHDNDDDSFCLEDSWNDQPRSFTSEFLLFDKEQSSRSNIIEDTLPISNAFPTHACDALSLPSINTPSIQKPPSPNERNDKDPLHLQSVKFSLKRLSRNLSNLSKMNDSKSLDFSELNCKLRDDLLSNVKLTDDDLMSQENDKAGLKVRFSLQEGSEVLNNEVSSKIMLPSTSREDLLLDLKELPMSGKFCAPIDVEKKSIIHKQAVKRHRRLLSEYVPEDLKDHIPPPQEAPPKEYAVTSPPSSFISMIKLIIGSLSVRPELPPFRFDTSEQSLEFNRKLLKNFDHDLEKLIPAYKNNVISPGSDPSITPPQ